MHIRNTSNDKNHNDKKTDIGKLAKLRSKTGMSNRVEGLRKIESYDMYIIVILEEGRYLMWNR